MELNEFKKFFDIKSDPINYDAFDQTNDKSKIDSDGFIVIDRAIDPNFIEKIRSKWLEKERLCKQSRFEVDLTFGQQDYTRNFFGKYIRHFSFYWNEPHCRNSRDLSLLLHFIRNQMLGYHPLLGLTFAPDRVGVYLAVTHYPVDSGEMAVHVDPNYFLPTHYVVPLTFKGEDYLSGGLMIEKDGNKIDVESMFSPGSLLFFNGQVPHSVAKISGTGPKSTLGRMQLFAIPTIFSTKPNNFARKMATEVYGRWKYANYSKNRGYKDNYQNFR